MSLILSIDLGTSSIKTAFIDFWGKMIDQIEKPYHSYSQSLYQVEQDPNEWWNIIQCEIKELLNRNHLSPMKHQNRIKAIACCGHSPSMVFLDHKGNLLRPSIIWQDRRAIKENKIISSILKKQNIKINFPSPLTPHSRITKLLWLKRNEPQTIHDLHYLMEPKDYINYKLTGICSTSLWSSREFRNIITGELNSSLLDALEIPEKFIPKAYLSETIIGTTQTAMNQESGLKEGIPVIAGEMDSISSIIGTGISTSGMGFNISGTSDIIGIATPKNNFSNCQFPIFYHYPFFLNLYLLFGVTQSTGQSIDWFNHLYQKELNSVSGGEYPNLKNPLFFLPFLEGSRSPHWNPDARAIFFGLNSLHNLIDMRHAIYQGIAFSLLENIHLLQKDSQLSQKNFPIKVSGGGANNHLLNQIKADVLGQNIIQTTVQESGLLGNAVLATLGLSVYQYKEAIDQMVHTKHVYYPDPKRQQFYQSQLFPIYQSLYSRNRSSYKLLASLKNFSI
jgi:xylulokinase